MQLLNMKFSANKRQKQFKFQLREPSHISCPMHTGHVEAKAGKHTAEDIL